MNSPSERPLCLHPLALSQWDRILLHGGGTLAFRKGSAPPPDSKCYRAKKEGVKYGFITQIAKEVLAGKYPGMTYPEIASVERVDSESLKSAVCRLRQLKARAAA